MANTSNVKASQHMTYVPKKQLQFNHIGGDGKMCLVFEASPADQGRGCGDMVSLSLLSALVPYYCYKTAYISAAYTFIWPVLFYPSLYFAMHTVSSARRSREAIEKMWLLKNGEQVVCQTFSGVMYKLNIIQIYGHSI